MSKTDIVKNAEKVNKIVDIYLKEKQDPIQRILDTVGEQWFSAPANTRTELGYAYTGGLCDLSLRICYWLQKLNKTMEKNIPTDSLMLVGLFHQLGKAGMPGQDLYVPQESDWHRNKGMMYTVNEDLKTMSVRDRTLYLLQHCGVELKDYEYQAIMLWEGQYSDENRVMRYRENPIALLLHWSYIWVSTQEKR
mgnify:CR=1 FL=1